MRVRAIIPTALTSVRLVLGLAFPWLPTAWRLPVFLVAMATEALDGMLARAWHVVGLIGQILDPIADKVFMLFALGALVWEGTIPAWSIPLVAARDLLVFAGCMRVWARDGRHALKRMPPSLLGKLATGGQYVWFLLLLTRPEWFAVGAAAFVIASTLSVAAGLHYLWRFDRSAS